jgi:hypothetical protein
MRHKRGNQALARKKKQINQNGGEAREIFEPKEKKIE